MNKLLGLGESPEQLFNEKHPTDNKVMSPVEDWWELVGSKIKNQPGENIHDTYLPFRIAKMAWEAAIKNCVLVEFKSDDENKMRFAREWAAFTAPKQVRQYVTGKSNLIKK